MKRFVSIAISLTILTIIYWRIDFNELVRTLSHSDGRWMVVAVGMVVPLTLFTAWRLQQLMPTRNSLGFIEANRLILAASGLNMVLPSKMGDIAKAYFMQKRGHLEGSLALSLVVFEKTSDMLSLLLWCAFGLILFPRKDWFFWLLTAIVAVGLVLGFLLLGSRKFAQLFFPIVQGVAPQKYTGKLEKLQVSWLEMLDYFWRDKVQLTKIWLTSIFIWFNRLRLTFFSFLSF